eukprot:g169.t1
MDERQQEQQIAASDPASLNDGEEKGCAGSTVSSDAGGHGTAVVNLDAEGEEGDEFWRQNEEVKMDNGEAFGSRGMPPPSPVTRGTIGMRDRQRLPSTKSYRRPPSAGVSASAAARIAQQEAAARRPTTAPAPSSPTKGEKILKAENLRLQSEIQKMRSDIFQKIRGGKRFVSGGGFRVAGGRPFDDRDSGRKGGKKEKKMEVSKNLRNAIRQLNIEKRAADQQAADLRLQISRIMQQMRAQQQELNNTKEELAKATDTQHLREKAIAELRKVVERLKGDNKLLKSQSDAQSKEILRLRGDLAKAREEAAAAANAMPAPLPPSPTKDLLREDVQKLREELQRAKQDYARLEQSFEAQADELSTVKREKEAQRQAHAATEKDLRSKSAELQQALDELRAAMATDGANLAELKDALRTAEANAQRLNKDNDRLRSELEAALEREKHHSANDSDAEKRIEELERQIAMLREELRKAKSSGAEDGRRSSELIKSLEAKLAEARDALDRKTAEMAIITKEAAATEAKLVQEQSNVRSLKEAGTQMKKELGHVRTDLKEQVRMVARAEENLSHARVQLDAAQREKRSIEATKKTIQEENTALKKKLEDALKQLKAYPGKVKEATQKAKKEAMEKSLQSMVRLCVVAPTVNVHFNQQEHECKAPMPQRRIKKIIQNDVLPHFTELFIQMEEGTAPNGSKLDGWLEEMLGEMQKSIQSHLADVFENMQGGGGGGGGGGGSSSIPPRPQTAQNMARSQSAARAGARRPSSSMQRRSRY